MALGTMTAGMDSTVEYLQGLTTHGPAGRAGRCSSATPSPMRPPACARSSTACAGPNVTFNQREASGLAAIAYASGLIRDGRVAAMISGGADRLEETFFKVQERFGPFARDEASRPFDRHRSGFVLGRSRRPAAARGGRRRRRARRPRLRRAARRRHDGVARRAERLARSIRRARRGRCRWRSTMRSVSASEVDAVFAAANGSRRLDALEAAAIRAVFGAQDVPVVSLKGASANRAPRAPWRSLPRC